MAVKKYNPTTSGRRKASVDDFSDITKKEPEKSLIVIRKKKSGRGMYGNITVRHKGGGADRFIRKIDFNQEKFDIPARVVSIEYDPNRKARIALLYYKDGEKRYIIAPVGLNVGDEILSSKNRTEIKPGNRMPLKEIPLGILVHNVELFPGTGGKIVRGAGSWAKLMAVEDGFARLRLPSSEIRKVPEMSMATIGQVSNIDAMHIRLGKAGRMRHLGVKPTVRGKAMNPVDHPHGGGEGHNPIGLKNPKTPWGKPALGVKTRKANKYSDKFIISRRKKKKDN
ncbi:50S ribosomal protein L2 [Candidatus Parcubacteria bacterium]|nr:MAG: 50S ribosomal protein L2 [Candidatus Parcubacteria bacterium]